MQFPYLLPFGVEPYTNNAALHWDNVMQPRRTQVIQDDNHKAFLQYCNTLRCPLCHCQLDGNVQKNKADLYCVSNNEEYICILFPNQEEFDLEQITFWYSQYQYTICISKLPNGNFISTVDQFNMDTVPEFRYRTRKQIFKYEGDKLMFFRTRMEEDVFLKKLKIYNIFS